MMAEHSMLAHLCWRICACGRLWCYKEVLQGAALGGAGGSRAPAGPTELPISSVQRRSPGIGSQTCGYALRAEVRASSRGSLDGGARESAESWTEEYICMGSP